MSRFAEVNLSRRSFVGGALMLGAASPFLLSACSSSNNSPAVDPAAVETSTG